MLYELYKKAYSLNYNQKNFLFERFDDILVLLGQNEQKEAEKQGFVKEARGSHDPETVEDMKKLINLLEKFLSIDRNLSYDNISVFMQPMSSGAKKVTLRPCRIVGLMRKLDRLSRTFKRKNKSFGPKELMEIEKEFFSNLNRIKERLSSKGPKLGLTIKKNAQKTSLLKGRIVEAINRVRKSGCSDDAIKHFITSNFEDSQEKKECLSDIF